MSLPREEAESYVRSFLATGKGPAIEGGTGGRTFVLSGDQSVDELTLALACARFMNGLGPDRTASDPAGAEAALELVRTVSEASNAAT